MKIERIALSTERNQKKKDDDLDAMLGYHKISLT